MRGRRCEPMKDGRPRLGPGDYGKDSAGTWWVRTPITGALFSLLDKNLSATENADGSINVNGIIEHHVNQTEIKRWKLEHGEWREV